ncbi:uncharacterized protein LOC105697897 [Orussus abietinus]|uniref:uncharacterized protein LOC105697897 n=1 Tax=Orussus abietinus TaxID=222816 RepID=UPI000626086E|nr:uncharacterized protein LOC105697897 [Orussus abietinus]
MRPSSWALGVIAIAFAMMIVITDAKDGTHREKSIDEERQGRYNPEANSTSNCTTETSEYENITEIIDGMASIISMERDDHEPSDIRTQENLSTPQNEVVHPRVSQRRNLYADEPDSSTKRVPPEDHEPIRDPPPSGTPPKSSLGTNDALKNYDGRGAVPAAALKSDNPEVSGPGGTNPDEASWTATPGRNVDKADGTKIEGMNDETPTTTGSSRAESPSPNLETRPLKSILTPDGGHRVVGDIEAISFKVPTPEDAVEDVALSKNLNVPGNSLGDRQDAKDKPGSSNSLLNPKSTKAFYEIKPSLNHPVTQKPEKHETSSHRNVGRFFLPGVASGAGRYGPYFEDGEEERNVTARIGSTVLLDCNIAMLGDKKVTWVQEKEDSFRLLTVGRTPYSVDQRVSLNFRYPSNWRLQIMYATLRDSSLYKCQVATHPPLIKKINVIITAPTLTIVDDSGRIVSGERHLKAGSALRLLCEARDVLESQNESVVWTRGDETLTEDVSENKTTEMMSGKKVQVIVSTVTVERATPKHAGNYSCMVPGRARTTVAVHVLNGELPAAVHDGNGVSRAVLNLWLIHLTVSYVFSR